MQPLKIIVALAIILATGVANPATIDCSKAAGRVEKTVCASKALSELDGRLAEAYDSALSSSGNPEEIKAGQRQWLRQVRDRCRDERCLKPAYEKRLAELSAIRQPGWRTFRDASLGIEFAYPGDRDIHVGCRKNKSCVALVGKSMPHSEYLIAFEVFDGPLEKVAVEHAVFEKRDGGWTARGRSSRHPALPIVGAGWQGLRSKVDCGVSDSQGFHAAAGECLWAVASNGKRSVVVDTQGRVGIDEASMRSIRSIRFIK